MMKTDKPIKESLNLFFPFVLLLITYYQETVWRSIGGKAFSFFTAAKVYFSDSTNANDVYIFFAARYRRKDEKKSY